MTESNHSISRTEIEGVLIISRPQYPDDRGFFREIFRKNDLETVVGTTLDFVQSNHSRSTKGTLRGIHVAPWHKLITVTAGEVQAVIVDCRPDSKTYGKHISIHLGESNFATMFVPAGCGNSYLVTSGVADYSYLVTDYWAPGKEFGVRYNDPDLAISWEAESPILSEKDAKNPLLQELFTKKF